MLPRLTLALLLLSPLTLPADSPPAAFPRSPEVQELVRHAVTAAGGDEKLLKLFELRERLVLGAKPPPALTPETKPSRTSVIEAPKHWWIGGKERGAEPAKWLVYGWSLGVLGDPQAKLELAPKLQIGDEECVGLTVSERVTPPMQLYFSVKTRRLVAIDWRSDRHLFSDWKTTAGGLAYPARTIGYKFKDAKAKTLGDPWYQTDILGVTPLTELPAGLTRTP